jgi:hypothetical protein
VSDVPVGVDARRAALGRPCHPYSARVQRAVGVVLEDVGDHRSTVEAASKLAHSDCRKGPIVENGARRA